MIDDSSVSVCVVCERPEITTCDGDEAVDPRTQVRQRSYSRDRYVSAHTTDERSGGGEGRGPPRGDFQFGLPVWDHAQLNLLYEESSA